MPSELAVSNNRPLICRLVIGKRLAYFTESGIVLKTKQREKLCQRPAAVSLTTSFG